MEKFIEIFEVLFWIAVFGVMIFLTGPLVVMIFKMFLEIWKYALWGF